MILHFYIGSNDIEITSVFFDLIVKSHVSLRSSIYQSREGAEIVLLRGNVVQSARTLIDLSIVECHKAILKFNL